MAAKKKVTPRDPRVSAILAKAPTFARPILGHLRDLIHEADPELTEDVKWRRPFFTLGGTPVVMIVAFKEHCTLRFWGAGARKVLEADGVDLDTITSLPELPSRDKLVGYVRKAVELARAGESAPRRKAPAKRPPLPVPPDFAAALARSRAASAKFDAFPPGHRRDYIEWILEAKREETREKRIREAVAAIAEGKERNWRYRAS